MNKGYCKIIVVLAFTASFYAASGQQSAFAPKRNLFSVFGREAENDDKRQVVVQKSIDPGHLSPTMLLLRFGAADSANPVSVRPIEKNLYVKGFGFFCRREMELEKSTRIPLRVRLGSLEQCNILEEKY